MPQPVVLRRHAIVPPSVLRRVVRLVYLLARTLDRHASRRGRWDRRRVAS